MSDESKVPTLSSDDPDGERRPASTESSRNSAPSGDGVDVVDGSAGPGRGASGGDDIARNELELLSRFSELRRELQGYGDGDSAPSGDGVYVDGREGRLRGDVRKELELSRRFSQLRGGMQAYGDGDSASSGDGREGLGRGDVRNDSKELELLRRFSELRGGMRGYGDGDSVTYEVTEEGDHAVESCRSNADGDDGGDDGDEGRGMGDGARRGLEWDRERGERRIGSQRETFRRNSTCCGDGRCEPEARDCDGAAPTTRLCLRSENLELQDEFPWPSWHKDACCRSRLYSKGLVDRTGLGLGWERGNCACCERCRGELEVGRKGEGEEDLKIMRKSKFGKSDTLEEKDGGGGGGGGGGGTVLLARQESCKLPDHLIESVVARLPVQSTFRFRCVSRAWRDMIYSNTFLRAYSDAPIRPTILFLVRRGGFGPPNVALFDPQSNRWFCISLPSPLHDVNWHATAADGGLVCYFGYENRSRTLFVVNPLTKSLRKLPAVHKTSSHISVLKMVMEERSKSAYKVFVVGMLPGESDGGGGETLGMEVYDSLTRRWVSGGIIPAKYPKLRPVYANGVLYVRCYDQKTLLLMFDTRTSIWHRIHTPLPQSLDREELVHYKGHILLVGLLAENYNVESVCVWELQRNHGPGNFFWKQVESMPRGLLEGVYRDRGYFECQSGDRIVMKCCQYGDMILCVASNSCNRGPMKVVGFDLGLRTWRMLPEMFKGKECRAYKVADGIFFESRLDVVA